MTAGELDALVARFQGPAGKTPGLSEAELRAMLQGLIDTGRIYGMDAGMLGWAEVYAQEGWVTGYDPARAPAEGEAP